MDLSSLRPFLDWISAHPELAHWVVFAIAAGESLAVVGILVPGVVLMLGVGALVGLGVLPLGSTLLWAAAGAVAGDGLSYWLGRHFDRQLRALWPFSRHHELIPRGERFFHKHGGKSILFGRFVGPVRPIIPAIAGIMHMHPAYFFTVNIVSALAWAPAVILPGVAFGSSLQLATAAAGRLVVLFLILALIVGVAVALVRHLITPLLLKWLGRWEEHWDFVVRNAVNSAFAAVLLLSTGVALTFVYFTEKHPPLPPQPLTASSWWQQDWLLLPRYRKANAHGEPLNVQYWGTLAALGSALRGAGWSDAATLAVDNAMLWLSPAPTIEGLPLMRHEFHERDEALFLVKPVHSKMALVLRVWNVNVNGDISAAASHLRLGSLDILTLQEPYPRFFYPQMQHAYRDALERFSQEVAGMNRQFQYQIKALGNVDGDGSHVMLLKQSE